jgi:nitrate reductase NapD
MSGLTTTHPEEAEMNLSGILVVAVPERLEAVVEGLNAMDGVQVHQVEAATGKVIAVQEAADIHAEISGLKRIKALPYVLMAEMVYHYLEEDQLVYDAMPEELQAREDRADACAVPAVLNS